MVRKKTGARWRIWEQWRYWVVQATTKQVIGWPPRGAGSSAELQELRKCSIFRLSEKSLQKSHVTNNDRLLNK